LFLILLLMPARAMCTVLTADTLWSGEVVVDQDILVPAGVTLTISPGAVIRVSPSESTKTDPEYMSPLTEITVRGTLISDGASGSPVTFVIAGGKKATWAGIIIDGGKGVFRNSVVNDAETGIYIVNGSLSLKDSLLTKNRYGLTVQGTLAEVRVDSSRIEKNDYGLILFDNAKIEGSGNVIAENRKKDEYKASAKDNSSLRPEAVRMEDKDRPEAKKEKSRIYGDEVLLGTTIWQGRIEVNGMVRVPEDSRLIIVPGTLVEFRRKDSNLDGIGENGLQIQGIIVAKGTEEEPIIFRSSEKKRAMGDWDAINIMNSDKGQNLIERCVIEDAYRGLHFHFSNVTVVNVALRNNYRGIQFQESVVEITGSRIYDNKSAIQARDSDILLSDNAVYHNYAGFNLFRNSLTMRDNIIVNNYQEGIRLREGLPVIERNLIDGNRHGLMINDSIYGTFAANVISHNHESGISLKNTDNIEISGNVVQANGLNGINIQDAGALISGNMITDNMERGIGVLSFHGSITGNTIMKNGLYNLGIDGTEPVSAFMNWWGEDDVRKMIYDKENDPSRGRADYLPMLQTPVSFPWPLRTISVNTAWHGEVAVRESLTVLPGAELVVSPNTAVLFGTGAGLLVKGKIIAKGEKGAVISFRSVQGKGQAEWDEILLDHAQGSAFSNSVFSNATWALHSHFTDLKVEGCAFVNNQGGIRFTSGPIDVRRSFFGKNEVGIRAFRGSAFITENIITGNDTGIFVREKGGGLRITRNNLFDNSGYSIRMGDFNNEDVDARDNWWGSDAPASKIYDAVTEPGIGAVRYEPISERPFALEAPVNVLDEKGIH